MKQDPISSNNRLISNFSTQLQGTVAVPGDKSISHRAIMLSSLAVGESRVTGLLEGEDVLATAQAMRQMGAHIAKNDSGDWVIYGVGQHGLKEPEDVLDMGNSGTSTRLIMGLLASHALTAFMTGDASLRSRPMQRVIKPMTELGAKITSRGKGRLPLCIEGTNNPIALEYQSPVASAQVKSCVLLSGLNTAGTTQLTESVATRDHTERMLTAMGVDVQSEPTEEGGLCVRLNGPVSLKPITIHVPGDISSAAFLLVAASIIPDSHVTLTNVGINPLRTGIINALQQMGADITIHDQTETGGEPVANITVKYVGLTGCTDLQIDPSTMIDEFPVLFCAAAVAKGQSHFKGLEELRVKESDRLHVMAVGLKKAGVSVQETSDGLIIDGNGGAVQGGCTIDSHLDHRIAMSFSILGLQAKKPIIIDDASPINTSFPNFKKLMVSLGANLD